MHDHYATDYCPAWCAHAGAHSEYESGSLDGRFYLGWHSRQLAQTGSFVIDITAEESRPTFSDEPPLIAPPTLTLYSPAESIQMTADEARNLAQALLTAAAQFETLESVD